MIAGIFHAGSGLGNQLHRYVMARSLAKDKGFEFGMIYPELFKGHFMDLDMGVPVKDLLHEFSEARALNAEGNDVRDYDWKIKEVKNYTLIDGEFQGERYYRHNLKEIDEWLRVEPLELSNDLCIIGFRGGEYVGVKDLFLPHNYWDKAITLMLGVNPSMQFEVHTDDVATAEQFFPFYKCVHDIALNWRSVRYAKHLIIANSSFYILPSLLGETEEIIAPEFWAGHNKGYWQLEQNKYERFTYI